MGWGGWGRVTSLSTLYRSYHDGYTSTYSSSGFCKLPTNGEQLPALTLEAVPGIEPRPQRWEARVLPLCHHGPLWVEEPVHTSWSTFCTVNHRALVSNYQLSNMKCPGRDSNRRPQRLKTSTLISLSKTTMFWIKETHFLFVGIFPWGNAETQTFPVSWNRDGFAFVESRSRKSGTLSPLAYTKLLCSFVGIFIHFLYVGRSVQLKVNTKTQLFPLSWNWTSFTLAEYQYVCNTLMSLTVTLMDFTHILHILLLNNKQKLINKLSSQ